MDGFGFFNEIIESDLPRPETPPPPPPPPQARSEPSDDVNQGYESDESAWSINDGPDNAISSRGQREHDPDPEPESEPESVSIRPTKRRRLANSSPASSPRHSRRVSTSPGPTAAEITQAHIVCKDRAEEWRSELGTQYLPMAFRHLKDDCDDHNCWCFHGLIDADYILECMSCSRRVSFQALPADKQAFPEIFDQLDQLLEDGKDTFEREPLVWDILAEFMFTAQAYLREQEERGWHSEAE